MTTNEIINPANLVYRKTPVLTDTPCTTARDAATA